MPDLMIRPDPRNYRTEINIRDQGLSTNRGIRKGFYLLGKELVKTARAGVMNPPKTGRIYRYKRESGRYKNHQASAPGEYPANETGAYRKSLGFEVRGGRQMEFGSDSEYGAYLEKGTSRMGPRPTLQKADAENRGKAFTILDREMKRALSREG